jgi:hypothetical protein
MHTYKPMFCLLHPSLKECIGLISHVSANQTLGSLEHLPFKDDFPSAMFEKIEGYLVEWAFLSIFSSNLYGHS